jgi:hypothetical protein
LKQHLKPPVFGFQKKHTRAMTCVRLVGRKSKKGPFRIASVLFLLFLAADRYVLHRGSSLGFFFSTMLLG